jgi:hypothetical protein
MESLNSLAANDQGARSNRIGGISAQFDEWIETLGFRSLLSRFPRTVGFL